MLWIACKTLCLMSINDRVMGCVGWSSGHKFRATGREQGRVESKRSLKLMAVALYTAPWYACRCRKCWRIEQWNWGHGTTSQRWSSSSNYRTYLYFTLLTLFALKVDSPSFVFQLKSIRGSDLSCVSYCFNQSENIPFMCWKKKRFMKKITLIINHDWPGTSKNILYMSTITCRHAYYDHTRIRLNYLCLSRSFSRIYCTMGHGPYRLHLHTANTRPSVV